MIAGTDISRLLGAYYGLKARDFRKTNVDNVTLRAQHEFEGGVTIRNTTRYGHSTQGYVRTQPDDQQGNVYGTNAADPARAGGYVWRRTNTRYSYAEGIINQTDLFGETSFLVLKHSFAASIELAWEKAANGSYVSNAATGTGIAAGSSQNPRCSTVMLARYNCTTVANPDPNDPWVSYASDTSTVLATIERGLPKTWTRSKVDSIGFSFFDTITITDNLLINLGGRYDRYETKVSPGLAATSTAERSWISRKDDLWNYQAGIIFKPTRASSIYVSTSSSATPPGSFLAQGSEGNGLNTSSQALTEALKIEKTRS